MAINSDYTVNLKFTNSELQQTQTAYGQCDPFDTTNSVLCSSGLLYGNIGTVVDMTRSRYTATGITDLLSTTTVTCTNYITDNVINVTGNISICNSGYIVCGSSIQNSQELQKYMKVQKIKNNLSVQIKSRVEQSFIVHKNEHKAIDTLHEIISESEFRKYLKYGFILVKAKSGDVYQVFKNRSHTKVWRNGKVIEEICVRLKDVPQTDNVIAFKTMIETDEEEFKKCGNIFKMSNTGIQINNVYQIAA